MTCRAGEDQRVNGQWIVAIGAEEIAQIVAASREMVSRVVKNMNARGLVRRDKRKMVILDWASMSATVGVKRAGISHL